MMMTRRRYSSPLSLSLWLCVQRFLSVLKLIDLVTPFPSPHTNTLAVRTSSRRHCRSFSSSSFHAVYDDDDDKSICCFCYSFSFSSSSSPFFVFIIVAAKYRRRVHAQLCGKILLSLFENNNNNNNNNNKTS